MKFKVGDKVKFIKSTIYHTDDVKIGETYKIIRIDNLSKSYQVENAEVFNEEELVKADYTYEDLKKAPIGTKVVLEKSKDEMLIKVTNKKFVSDNYRFYISDFENLETETHGKIIKIEEPGYTTVFEYKPEVLDDAEKRYLRGVIRPFRDKVTMIRKLFSPTRGEYYIQARYKEDTATNFPYFDDKTMYKGMETGKEYTLEDLGL